MQSTNTVMPEYAVKKSLDLGCGPKPRNKFLAEEIYGIDIRNNLGGNVLAADLVTDPIPFPDGEFDFVTAFDFIEHVPRIIYCPQKRAPFVELMNEIYRVLKMGGLFFSSTPAYPHPAAFQDPTHVNIITDKTFPYYFDEKKRYAAMYGFTGYFTIVEQVWHHQHLHSTLMKIEKPK